MKDIIIGAAYNYPWEKIQIWALSLATSGYTGYGALILYDDPEKPSENTLNIIEQIKPFNFQTLVVQPRTKFSRFLDYYEALRPVIGQARYAVVTDVRDVLFQTNPSDWLSNGLKSRVYAATEAIKHRDSIWARQNAKDAFSGFSERLLDQEVYNIGVIAGTPQGVADMCLSIGLMARASGHDISEQAAFNLLLSMDQFRHVQKGNEFVANLENVMDTDARGLLTYPLPYLDDGIVRTHTGEVFPIVHQYDSAPAWIAPMLAKLNERLA